MSTAIAYEEQSMSVYTSDPVSSTVNYRIIGRSPKRGITVIQLDLEERVYRFEATQHDLSKFQDSRSNLQFGECSTRREFQEAALLVRNRILSFCDYQDGWAGEGSKAPDIVGLKWLAQEFLESFGRPNLPSVFLTFDGDVIEMEWRKDDRSVSLTVSLSSKTAEWFSFFPADNHDRRDFTEVISLDDRKGWERLNNLVHGLFSTG